MKFKKGDCVIRHTGTTGMVIGTNNVGDYWVKFRYNETSWWYHHSGFGLTLAPKEQWHEIKLRVSGNEIQDR